jgi:ElaB/YqjD/DUF883 family membrane-anchored ribosome-binding protein
MLDTKDNIKGKFGDAADKAMAGPQEVWDKTRATGKAPEGAAAGGLVEAVKEKVQDVATGASELAGKAKDTAQEWASSVGSAAVQARDKAVELTSAAVSKAEDLGLEVTKLIRRYPLQALLVGFGVGFGAGILAAQLLRRS